MSADLDALLDEGLARLAAADDLDALQEAVGTVLGKRGALTAIQRGLGQLDPEARRTVGAQVNAARERFTAALDARRAELTDQRDRVVLAAEAVDVTLPPRTPARGSVHPITETVDALLEVFVGLGYRVVRGPEVESDWFNFGAMNMPADHPARSLHDTIYLAGEGAPLLRTQTSPMQARAMLAQDPPVHVVVPGRVYRQETPDATHLPAFHQIEGLAVDVDISFADLRGTLAAAARALLGPEVELRFVPDHFPFTEPSAQLEARLGGRWLELLGSGMVHPDVLRAVGYDPEAVRGFAFGIGVERMAMLRHGVEDLRAFIDNDLRFLAHF